MKKEFTEDQLVYIRDIFVGLCEKYIDSGKRDDAQETLDIVNVVQSKLNCDEYESLETYILDESGTYQYIELKEPSGYEIAAIEKMKEFAISSDNEPSDDMKNFVNIYCEECCANIGLTPKSIINRRKAAINRLIIRCMTSCTDDELKKLDAIVTFLAKERRN